MLRPVKTNILNTIQLTGEVNAALLDYSLVVVEKRNIGANYEQPVYDVYACQGKVEDGDIIEHQK